MARGLVRCLGPHPHLRAAAILLAATVLATGCEAAPSTSTTRGVLPTATSPADGSPTSPPSARVATPASSQARVERPVAVTLPSGRVLPVDPAGTRPDGSLAVPDDIRRAGWWQGSSRLGDPFSSVVLAAHVDSFAQGVGPAAELLSAQPGDVVVLAGRHLTERYRIVSVRLVPRADLRHGSAVFSAAAGDGRLVLITCGGEYDPTRGGYQDNVVVLARRR